MLVTWPHVKMSLGRRPNYSWWPDGQACRMARSYPWMWMSEGESSCKAIWIIYKLVFMQKRLKGLDVRLNRPASETPQFTQVTIWRIKTPNWFQNISAADWSKASRELRLLFEMWSGEQVHRPDETTERGYFVWPGQGRGHLKRLRGPRRLLSCDRWGEEFSEELIWECEGALSVRRISVVAQDLQHIKRVSGIWTASSASYGGSFVLVWNINGELWLNTGIKADPLGLKWQNQVSTKLPEIQSEPWAVMSKSSK